MRVSHCCPLLSSQAQSTNLHTSLSVSIASLFMAKINSRERRDWLINCTGIAMGAYDLSHSLAQIDSSSSAQSVTGNRLCRIKNGHPFRAPPPSSIWQCFVLVQRGRPKVRGCAAERARERSLWIHQIFAGLRFAMLSGWVSVKK